ncbi:MAG: hypothetical protein A2X28_10980 [Elusimicrobia bacterium GWA2_56_46]|nr:MAG: hypothetical protein A2X28_10980 [Elusimicrobia bacterium GWA2_56_46]OGR56253.1 MAG: hypothetical protein A2X39_10350 [Elusimicrobia bacterium GWC2_56_31]HBB66336.1 hypothetical protein [Elusimicrobiota bacterium]HBW22385.1 hypothetical protein [Elusimicrobiota bacterium]
MKKIFAAILFLTFAAGITMAGAGKSVECPFAKSRKCALCPEKMKGVETTVRNTEKGVEITMTAKDSGLIAKVQEMALVHYNARDTMEPGCPGRVEGAQVKITNTAAGAIAEITGATPEVTKKIQEASMKEHKYAAAPAGEKKQAPKKEAKKPAGYICPMGCTTSDKPGKCPKCGMNMKENK